MRSEGGRDGGAQDDPAAEGGSPWWAQAFRFAVCVAVSGLIWDVVNSLRHRPLSSDLILALGSVAVLVAAGLLIVVLPLWWISSGYGGRRWRLLVPVAVFMLVLGPRIHALFIGDWISQQGWRPLAEGAALGLFAAFLYGFLLWAGARQRRAKGHCSVSLLVVLLATATLAVALDHSEFLARKYLPFHDILACCALAALGALGVVAGRWPARATSLILPLAGAAVLLVVYGEGGLSRDNPALRRILLRDARLTPRIMAWFFPPVELGDVVALDRELLARLQRVRPPEVSRRDREQRDVILLTIDTLRFDALSLTGGTARTPVLDRFLKKGLLFTRAWSQYPSTSYSVTSFLAGQYPAAFFGGRMGAADSPNLPESLSRGGYDTLAFTSFPPSLFTLHQERLRQGFDQFHNDGGTPGERSRRVVARALEALAGKRGRDDPPRFLWLHLFDPHTPYTQRPGVDGEAPPRRWYDGEVEHVDASLAPFLERLAQLKPEPWVVVFSDHGEEFSDHGGIGHNTSLYDEQIHVPLAIMGPGLRCGRESHPVELIDIPATVRHLVGLPQGRGTRGQSLRPILEGTARDAWPPGISFAQFRWPQFVNGRLDAVQDRRWKLIHNLDLGLFELYDLKNDPDEKNDLALQQPSQLRRMQGLLRTMRAHAGSSDSPAGSSPATSPGGSLANSLKLRFSAEARARWRSGILQGNITDIQLLQQIVDHEEAEVRRLGILQAALWPGQEKARLFLRRAGLPGVRGREARLALALLGVEKRPFPPDLCSSLWQDFPGMWRSLPLLARALCGEEELLGAVRLDFAGPEGDPHINLLILKTLMLRQDVYFLLQVYLRMTLGPISPLELSGALEATAELSLPLAAPLLRGSLSSADRGIRQQAQALMGSRGVEDSWQDALRKAEELRRRARQVASEKSSGRDLALKLLREALGVMVQVDLVDYGLVSDMALLLNTWGKPEELGEWLDGVLPGGGGQDRKVAELVERLLLLSRGTGMTASGSLAILPGQDLGPGDCGRMPLLVRVTLDENGGALFGSLSGDAYFLGGAVHGADRQLLPGGGGRLVPLTGLLPGESQVFCIPVLLPEKARPLRILVGLSRGGRDLPGWKKVFLDRR